MLPAVAKGLKVENMSKYNFEQKRNDYETPPELFFEGLKMTRIFTGYACDVYRTNPLLIRLFLHK